MGARQRLTLLAAASGAVLIVLGRTAHGAAEQLVQVPPQAWGLSDLSDAVVAGTCTCGALGALWHVVSALLALMALPRANGPSKRCRGGARALAVRVLEAWGAPAVRRIVASALLVSLSSAPALASEETSSGDDLGCRLTDVAVLDAVAAGRSAPVERFDRFQRLRRRKPVSGLDTAGQPGGTALHRPRLRALLRAHSYRRTRREPVVHHRSPPAHRLRPRTDRAGLAGPVPRQLRGHRRRPVADPAWHGPECPGLPVRTEHIGRRSSAITMNRNAPAPAAPAVGPDHLPHSTSHSVPTGHPPTPRSPP